MSVKPATSNPRSSFGKYRDIPDTLFPLFVFPQSAIQSVWNHRCSFSLRRKELYCGSNDPISPVATVRTHLSQTIERKWHTLATLGQWERDGDSDSQYHDHSLQTSTELAVENSSSQLILGEGKRYNERTIIQLTGDCLRKWFSLSCLRVVMGPAYFRCLGASKMHFMGAKKMRWATTKVWESLSRLHDNALL